LVGFQIRFYASTGQLTTGPLANRTKMSGFRITSLDHFIKKRVIKNILLTTKRSRLEVKKTFGSHLVLTIPNLDKKVRFSDGRNKMAAKPFKIRTIKVSLKMTI
jgi:hypothetical protein